MSDSAAVPGLSVPSQRRPKTAAVAVALVAVVAVCAALYLRATGPSTSSGAVQLPLATYSAPASVVAGTAATSGGLVYVLANTGSAANVQAINTATNTVSQILPVSNASRSVAVSSTGTVAVATAAGTTGSLLFISKSGVHHGVVALPGPTQQVIAEADGRSFLALVDAKGDFAAVSVNSTTNKVSGVTPLSNLSLSLTVSPDGTTIYDLLSTSVVQLVSVQNGKPFESFSVPTGGRAIALSADGSTLYELKGSSSDNNIAVLNVSTQSVKTVMPAPANCVGIAPSLTSLQVYDFVGTPRYSNVQLFATHL